MIKEILCQKAIEYEYPPDGGNTPVLDGYDGCQLNCPYCFQWRDPAWNKNILVKTNFPEVLAQELVAWDPSQTLYIGSRGDPYMPLEGKYRLTRRILQVLLAHGVPCILSTKSNSHAFFEDIGLFRQYGEKLIICIGQANVMHLRKIADPGNLPNIRTANELARQGIQTWVFITPVLPGITDVKTMVDALPVDMPVFLDKLRLDSRSAFKQRFFNYLDTWYPSLEPRYRKIMQDGDDPYYQELKEMYHDHPRVKFVFGDS
ncbi:MAG: SPL family radical SAM protein [Omnitrophica WOR_2 bacterium]